MGIKVARMLFVLCMAWVFYWGVNRMVVGYALFMWAMSELLNSRDSYRQLPYHRAYNALFVGLLLFTTLDRSRKSVIPAVWEYTLDISVHFLFSTISILLICLLAIVFLKGRTIKPTSLVIMAVVLFNIIGVVNEFYQNMFKPKHVDFWVIDNESKLDLTVNLLSSMVYIIWSYRFPKYFPSLHKKTD